MHTCYLLAGRSIRAKTVAVLTCKTEGTVLPNVDWPRMANNKFIFFSMVMLWRQLLWWVLIKTTKFKSGILYTCIWHFGHKKWWKKLAKLPNCWMGTFYGVTKTLKWSKLEILERSIHGVRLGKSGLLEQAQLAVRFTGCKDLGWRNTEKLVKQNHSLNA